MVSTIQATATPATLPVQKISAGNRASVPTTVIVQPAQSQLFSQVNWKDINIILQQGYGRWEKMKNKDKMDKG